MFKRNSQRSGKGREKPERRSGVGMWPKSLRSRGVVGEEA